LPGLVTYEAPYESETDNRAGYQRIEPLGERP
jgi:hypothetical protein